MSEEEEETLETINEEPETIAEQLAPENVKPTTLNKNGKPRKQLSQEHLERLAKARAKANAIRKQNSIKKLEDKIENINKQTEPILGTKPKKEIKKDPEPEPEVLNETIEEDKSEVKERKKKSTKKKTKIIVEQSSDDSDEFEPNDNVVFVKRVSRKKKEPEEPPAIERQQAYQQPPPEPPPKPPMKPQLTPQQMMLRDNYNAMFSGNFINQQGMRRHY
jgi:hypothetical protein